MTGDQAKVAITLLANHVTASEACALRHPDTAPDHVRHAAAYRAAIKVLLDAAPLVVAVPMPQPITGHEPAPVGVPSHSSAYHVGRRV